MSSLKSVPSVDGMTQDVRKRRLAIFGGALLVVIAAVAVVIAVSSGGGSSSGSGGGSAKAGTAFAGIPQSGNTLGSPRAKATMMVFADMQCPFCRQFETQVFPSIVQRYVKTGKLKVVFQPISILGSDSVVASKAVVAAAEQNKLFDYASTFYANQGEENTGYVTEGFLNKIANATPGLGVAKWKSALAEESGASILSGAEGAARTAGVSSTPSFFVAKRGQTLAAFQPNALTAKAFYGKLDAVTQ
jgi:protein-disulfide isomerase